MCIIATKPYGKKLQDKSILKNCFDNNPDGAGFMFVRKSKLHIRKGYMTFKRFYQELTSYNFTEDDVVIMHFRIATHGEVNPSNCHPFPISDNIEMLQSLNVACQRGIVHNGIISIKPDDGISDTMQFVKDVLFGLQETLHSPYVEKCISLAIGNSKLAIMDYNGNTKLYGSGWLTNDGYHYSNDTYLECFNSWYDDYIYNFKQAKQIKQKKTVNDFYSYDKCPMCHSYDIKILSDNSMFCTECGCSSDDYKGRW